MSAFDQSRVDVSTAMVSLVRHDLTAVAGNRQGLAGVVVGSREPGIKRRIDNDPKLVRPRRHCLVLKIVAKQPATQTKSLARNRGQDEQGYPSVLLVKPTLQGNA